MNLSAALWYGVGIIVVLLVLRIMAKPLQLMVRVLGNSIAGGVALWAINLVGGFIHLHLAVNPISAVIVGMLGLPGILALGIMRSIVG